jgi:hypothetical protein
MFDCGQPKSREIYVRSLGAEMPVNHVAGPSVYVEVHN